MKHPFSVFSNLTYIVVGLLMIFSGHPAGPFAGVSSIVLGIGSGYYHFSRNKEHQLADEAGMYLVFSVLLATSILTVIPNTTETVFVVLVLGAITGVILAAAADQDGVDSMVVLPCLVIPTLVILGFGRGWLDAGWLFAGFILIELWRELPEGNFGPARPPWLRRLYDPIHGTWHFGSGTFIYALYLVATATDLPAWLVEVW